jgi:hypothetical protein
MHAVFGITSARNMREAASPVATRSVIRLHVEPLCLTVQGRVMHFSFIAAPEQTVLSVTEASSGYPLIPFWGVVGLGVAAVLVTYLRPRPSMLTRAAMGLSRHCGTDTRRVKPDVLNAVAALNRMARDLDETQPNQAAELRWLASHGGTANAPGVGLVWPRE